MAGRQIVITGDTSQLRRSILDVSKTVNKELKSSKINLFTEDSKNFLRKEAKEHLSTIKKNVTQIRKEVEEEAKALKNVTKGSAKELELKEKIIAKTKLLNKLEKERSSIQGGLTNLNQGRLGGMLKKIPGLGKLGMGGALATGGIAALGLAGSFALSRAKAGADTYQQGLGDRVKLLGRGVADLETLNPQEAAAAGLNAQSLRAQRLKALDVFGRSGATQEATIQRSKFERGFGIESGTLSGLGANLRGVMGGQGAQRSVMSMQASLIASGITDEIGPYLQTSANLLNNINERGFTFDDQTLGLFNKLIDNTGRIEESNKLINGVDDAIRSSTGEQNAFFQDVYNLAGIGGGTIGGTQAAIRSGGFFGMNLEKMGQGISPADKLMFEQLGMGNQTMSKVSTSLMSRVEDLFGTESENLAKLQSTNPQEQEQGRIERLGRNRFLMNMFKVNSEADAAKISKLLQEAATGSSESQEKVRDEIKKIQEQNSEMGNLKLIRKTNEGILEETKNMRTTALDELGARLSSPLIGMEKALLSIDQGMGSILESMGLSTGSMQQRDVLAGKKPLTEEGIKEITRGDQYRANELAKNLQGELSKSVEKQQELKEQIAKETPQFRERTISMRGDRFKVKDRIQSEAEKELQKERERAANLSKSLETPALQRAVQSMETMAKEFKRFFDESKKAGLVNVKANPNKNSSTPDDDPMLKALKRIESATLDQTNKVLHSARTSRGRNKN